MVQAGAPWRQLRSSRPGTHRSLGAKGVKAPCEMPSRLRGTPRRQASRGTHRKRGDGDVHLSLQERGNVFPTGMASLTKWPLPTGGPVPQKGRAVARSFDLLTPARSANIKDVNIKDVLGPLCHIRADVPACGRATSAAISTINFLQVPIAHFTPRKDFLYLLHLTVDCKLCRETPVQELMYFNLRGAYFVDNKFEVFHV